MKLSEPLSQYLLEEAKKPRHSSNILLIEQDPIEGPESIPILELFSRKHSLDELFALKDTETGHQKEVAFLFLSLFEPRFSLMKSPHQVYRTLVNSEVQDRIDFKSDEILSMDASAFRKRIELLEDLELFLHRFKKEPLSYNLIPETDKETLHLCIGLYTACKRMLDLVQANFLRLVSVNDLGHILNDAQTLHDTLPDELILKAQKPILDFLDREKEKDTLKTFVLRLSLMKQELSEYIFLEQKTAGVRINLELNARNMLEVEAPDNPEEVLQDFTLLRDWIDTELPWQKLWLKLDLEELDKIVRMLTRNISDLKKQRETILEKANPDFLNLDAKELKEKYADRLNSFTRWFYPSFYRMRTLLKANLKEFPMKQQPLLNLLHSLQEYQERLSKLEKRLEKSRKLFTGIYKGMDTDFDRMLLEEEFQKSYRLFISQFDDYEKLKEQCELSHQNIQSDFGQLLDCGLELQELLSVLNWLIRCFNHPIPPSSALENASLLMEYPETDFDEKYQQELLKQCGIYKNKCVALCKALENKTLQDQLLNSAIEQDEQICKELYIQADRVLEYQNLCEQLENLEDLASFLNGVDKKSLSENSSLVLLFENNFYRKWLDQALISIADKSGFEQSEKIASELRTLLVLHAKQKTEPESLVLNDTTWLENIPVLLSLAYPVWKVDSPEQMIHLQKFDFRPVLTSEKILEKNSFWLGGKEVYSFESFEPEPEPVSEPKEIPVLEQIRKENPTMEKTPKTDNWTQPDPDELKDQVLKIVQEQYPVHGDILSGQLLPLYGRKRMTPTLRRSIQHELESMDNIEFHGDFLFPKGYTSVPIHNEKRKLAHISKEEMIEALKKASVKNKGAKSIVFEAALLLGFQTINTPIEKALKEVYDSLAEKEE